MPRSFFSLLFTLDSLSAAAPYPHGLPSRFMSFESFSAFNLSLAIFVPPVGANHRWTVRRPPPDLAVDVIAGTLFDSVARHCFVCSSILRIFYFFFILIPFPPSLRCSRWFKFFSESFGTLRLLTLPTGSPLTPGACSLGRHPPSFAAAQVPPLPCPCRRRATAPPSPVLRCGCRFPLLSLLRRGRHACAVP